jgi:large subunit ribosomal protein L2
MRPTGELRAFPEDCRATVGTVSNHLQGMINLGKAGANRARGRRPKVRGIAMNPVDHPHGGRTNGGRPSCTPWGVYTKGKRTRKRNNPTNEYILMRKGGQPISKFVNAKKRAVREAAMKRKNKQGGVSNKS